MPKAISTWIYECNICGQGFTGPNAEDIATKHENGHEKLKIPVEVEAKYTPGLSRPRYIIVTYEDGSRARYLFSDMV